METTLAYITAKDRDEAKRIGRVLLEKKLVACTNIIEGMESSYWWEGKIEESTEAILIAKTDRRLVDEVIKAVKAMHSYSVPCVLTLPVTQGNSDYIQWLNSNLKPQST